MSNIEVYVRMRPFNQKQLSLPSVNHRLQLQPSSGQIQIANESGNQAKRFQFDGVFDKWTTQEQLYEKCNIDSMVHKVLEGYNSTVLTYGQTGAGKTYTMDGDFMSAGEKSKMNIDSSLSNNNLGLVPRVLRSIFNRVEGQSKREFKISLSFVQIYKENIYDLFDSKSEKLSHGLRLRWNKLEQFIVEKLKVKPCLNLQEALKVYSKGSSNKIMGKHKMNMFSSRSHSLFTIRVESYLNEDPENTLVSKFCLVDLAGSEKQELTGTLGKHFKESVEINKSLFTLRQVISALVESKGYKQFDDDPYIPYRDSKLTCLLKQSFGGNNYTTMIACLNPGNTYIQESIQTLSYATMTNKIKNVPIKGEDQRILEINRLREQLHKTTDQLHKANNHIKTLTLLIEQKTLTIEQLTKGGAVIDPKPYKESKELEGCKKKHSDQLEQIELIKTRIEPTEPFKTKRSNKEILESLVMVKELVNSNMILRENNEEMSKTLFKKEKEIYELIKENDRLRDRWDMFFNKASSQQTLTLDYVNPLTQSVHTAHNKTAEKLENIKQIRKRRLNSISGEQSKYQQPSQLTYHQFINSRYRVTSKGTKRGKSKKYSVL